MCGHPQVLPALPYVVDRMIRILHQGAEFNKERVFIPTGFQSKELIVKANFGGSTYPGALVGKIPMQIGRAHV